MALPPVHVLLPRLNLMAVMELRYKPKRKVIIVACGIFLFDIELANRLMSEDRTNIYRLRRKRSVKRDELNLV